MSLCNQVSSFSNRQKRADTNIEGELSGARKRLGRSGRGKEEKESKGSMNIIKIPVYVKHTKKF